MVNNAAKFLGWKRIDDISVQEFQSLWEVNVLAYFVAARATLPHLRQRRGSIVNVGSIAGEVGSWRETAYATTKGAVSAFTRALAIEEAENGVRVNAVAPGVVDTAARRSAEERVTQRHEFHSFLEGLSCFGRSATPEEVARTCLFLASDAASFITGVTLNVTGGLELGFGRKYPHPDFEWT